ncbi:hypothetical protein [Helicobacter cappadocius]|uniref:Uncharacterized protein n=1 Tax=Helicobacter cappadocius TaxID=3063998 RepID=A0AA90PKP4_9HELI|nr:MULTISPECIES: hypothetical protein [unclassified Helicobacter]MDO7253900.1 hypothetical protein [Helicobacter sp. faydin-H75]MDP2539761.1 hypothetical protein [Helicobacter sp. faydin-H76]
MSNLEQDLSKHIQKALNKTINKIQKEQAKIIKEEMDLPLAKIKKMSRVKKAQMNNLKASIMSLDTLVSLKHFKKSPVKSGKKIIGINVKLNKSTKVFLKGHFIAKNKDKGGEFIAIRENSKHSRNPNFNYKASRKSYAGFNGSSKLYYPMSSKSFAEIAKEQTNKLMPKAKEMFLKELDR